MPVTLLLSEATDTWPSYLTDEHIEHIYIYIHIHTSASVHMALGIPPGNTAQSTKHLRGFSLPQGNPSETPTCPAWRWQISLGAATCEQLHQMHISTSLRNPPLEREEFSQGKKGFKGSKRAGTQLGLSPKRATNVVDKAQDCK